MTRPLDRRLADLAGLDIIERLRRLNDAIATATGPCDLPDHVLRTSIERLLRHPLRTSRLRTLEELLDVPPEHLGPPAAVLRSKVFAPALGPAAALPASFGLSATAPTADPGRAALSFAERRWADDGRLALKLRLAAFLDADGRLCWEFGVVAHRPSVAGLNAGLDAAALLARRFGALIDLTPSGYHAAALATRLGGRARDHAAFLRELALIRAAAARHAAAIGVRRLSGSQIGVLLAQGALLDPGSGAPMAWDPPRLLRLARPGRPA